MSRAAGACCCEEPGGVRLTVRVIPRAKRSAVAGIVDIGEDRRALGIRLAAPPVEGAANRALVAFLAGELGVAASSVRIVAGERSRIKVVAIAGIGPAEIAWLAP